MIHSLTLLSKNQKQTTASGTFSCVVLSGEQLHGRKEESLDKYRAHGLSIFMLNTLLFLNFFEDLLMIELLQG